MRCWNTILLFAAGADLSGADLTDAAHLDASSLDDRTKWSAETKWPAGFAAPAPPRTVA